MSFIANEPVIALVNCFSEVTYGYCKITFAQMPQYPSEIWHYPNERTDAAWYGLEITCQWDKDHFKPYAFLTRFTDGPTYASAAATMAKVLAKLDKGLGELNNKFGWLDEGDFGGYAARVLAVLKVNIAVNLNSRMQAHSEPGSVKDWLETAIHQHKQNLDVL